jgi:hypothetical protein
MTPAQQGSFVQEAWVGRAELLRRLGSAFFLR